MMTPEEEKELRELRAVKEEYLGMFPRFDFFNENRGYYASMPFIPQDMGFEHTTIKPKGSRMMDIFHKDGVSATKIDSGEWMVQKEDARMAFTFKNRFEAYIVLRALGMVFDAPNPDLDPDM